MLFHGPTNTGLGTGNSFARSHLSDPLVLKVAFHFDTQTLQSSLTNAGSSHRDIGDDRRNFPAADLII